MTASEKLRFFLEFSRNIETVVYGQLFRMTISPVQSEIPLFKGDETDLVELATPSPKKDLAKLISEPLQINYLVGGRYIVQQVPQDEKLEISVIFHMDSNQSINAQDAECILAFINS